MGVTQPAGGKPEHFRGTLLLRDVRTTYLLVNHARHQAVHRVFGLPPEQDNVLTLIALSLLASAVHDGYRRVADAPGVPSGGDLLLGGASLSEAMTGIAGPSSRKAPMLGMLLLAALLAGGARPVIRKSLSGVLSEERRLSFDFHRRYGYLLDPGHWRRRRAERRAGAPELGAPPSQPAGGTA